MHEIDLHEAEEIRHGRQFLQDGGTHNNPFDSVPREVFLARLTYVLPKRAVTSKLHTWALHHPIFMY